MKLSKIFAAGLAAASVMLSGAIYAQPVIANVVPLDGYHFQLSGALTFTATSSVGITNIAVQLTGTKLTGGSPVLRSLSLGNGLVVSGNLNSYNATISLNSNIIYSAVIQVADANGALTSSTVAFDTINPAYTFEAEDYDFASNGISGLFIPDPQTGGGLVMQTNGYAGLSSTYQVDFNHSATAGNGSYRPISVTTITGTTTNVTAVGLATEGSQDWRRVQYNAFDGQNQGFDVGFNNSGDFANYTRHYPAGTYNIYLRGATGGGSAVQNDAASVTTYSGNFGGNAAALSGAGPYQFSVPKLPGPGGNNPWQGWSWDPLLDSNTNLVQVTFDGSTNTLRVTIDGGNCNEDFYLLVPTNSNPSVPSTVSITNIYPDGASQFEQTNIFVFTANSLIGINPGDIVVQLTGTNLIGQGAAPLLTAGNGLTITGSSTSWNVSFALATNTVYNAFIQIADVNGNPISTNITFDTVSPDYYTFEAEDYNFSGGGFFDNPQTNSYYGTIGQSGVDFICANPGGSGGYSRGISGLTLEQTGDKSRAAYLGDGNINKDYDVDNVSSGDWANYSRTFPPGIYNIYMRAANGTGSGSDSASMSLVADPADPSPQAITKLGTFAVANTGGWGTFGWTPLLNGGGGLARVTFDGVSTNTLRETVDGGSYNANYYMLVPADNTIQTKPFVSGFQPDGSSLFQFTNELNFTANSEPGLSTNNVVVNLNGANVSGLTFNGIPGSPGNWNVSYPLRPNTYYTAIVTLTDSYGTTLFTNSFGTFNATNYQWEAEDYDYTSNSISGLFFDNPQVDSYLGLPGLTGVDVFVANQGVLTRGNVYRPAGYGNLPDATAGDVPRSQFTSGKTDYNIGSFGNGAWVNFTRNYPPGTYNVVGRFAEGSSAAQTSLSKVSSGYGTANQTVSALGVFTAANEGWGTWQWASLKDTNGNLAQVTLDGSQTTLRLSGLDNEVNVNFFMLTPADTALPVISGVSPNGSSLFQNSNTLNFVVGSTAGIETNNVVVTLNGVIVTNLVFTGSSTAWNVSYSDLQSNETYTAVITVTSLNGEAVSITNNFDTINAANYQWEAEDYDYTSGGVSGQFFDNPQVGSYTNLQGAAGIDFIESDTQAPNRGFTYRQFTNGIPDTSANDKSRIQFTTAGKVDYSIGSFGGGSWANYTRHYPAGTYNVIGRFAEGAGTAQFTLSQLAGGYGTSNQIASPLGTFSIPNEGWGTWQYATLLDANGNPAKISLDGSQTTLRLIGENNNEANVNFFILTPTTPAPMLKAVVSGSNVGLWFFAQTGYNYQIQYKNNLTDANWINLGSPVSGNNTNNVVNDPLTGSTRFYRIHP